MKLHVMFASVVLTLVSAVASAQLQIIARIAPGYDPAGIANSCGIILKDVTTPSPFVLFVVPSSVDGDVAQQKLQSSPGVVWAEDDENVSMPEDLKKKGGSLSVIGGRDELAKRNVNMLKQIQWSPALANLGNNTVRMAILDTGLSKLQPELWAHVDAYQDEITAGGDANDIPMGIDSNHNGLLDEGVGHGTMVAGIANLVAPKVRLVIAKVADSDGNATAWSLIKGLAFAHHSGAVVANVSLGSANEIPALSDVADWCDEVGLYWVAPAGNGDQSYAMYPAKISSVVCVTGLNSNSTKADFSNWDSSAVSSAPAVGVTTQWWDGTMGQGSGTSFSAPFVTASIAEFLRHGGVVQESIKKTVIEAGFSVDKINPKYKGKLGTKLSFIRMITNGFRFGYGNP